MENPFKNINTNIFNAPKYETPKINPEVFMDLRDTDEVTNNILTF